MDVAASDVALAGTFEGISGNPVRRRRTHSEYVIESFQFSDFSDRGMCGCAIMAESDTAAMVTLISGTLVRRGSTHSARVTEFLQFSCSRSSCRRSRLPGWVGGKIFPHRLGPAPQWSPGAGGKILPRVRPAQGAAAVRGRSVPSFRCGRGAALRTCKGSCRGMQFVCWFSGCRQGAIILDLPGQVIHSRTNMPGSQPAWDGVQDCRWGVYFLVCALWVIMLVLLAWLRYDMLGGHCGDPVGVPRVFFCAAPVPWDLGARRGSGNLFWWCLRSAQGKRIYAARRAGVQRRRLSRCMVRRMVSSSKRGCGITGSRVPFFVAVFVGIFLGVILLVIWQAGLTGVVIGEAAVPGPASQDVRVCEYFPTKHVACPQCATWVSSAAALWRHRRRFHAPTSVSASGENHGKTLLVDTDSDPTPPFAPAPGVTSAPDTWIGSQLFSLDDFSDCDTCSSDDMTKSDTCSSSRVPCRETPSDIARRRGPCRWFDSGSEGHGVTICAANVTSLHTQMDAAITLPGHVHGLTEVRLTLSGQVHMEASFRELGRPIVFGKPLPAWRTQWGAKCGGVAIAALPGVEIQRVEASTEIERELWDSCRWVHAVLALGNGSTMLHIMCVYGYSGAANKYERMRLNENLLSKTLAAAAEYGNVPVVLIGDVNVPPETSLAVSSAIMTGRWVDAACSIAAARGEAPDPTCFVHDVSAGSRIDVILCNSTASGMLMDFGLVGDSGLPVHLPVACKLRLQAASQIVKRSLKPLRIPLDWEDSVEEAERLHSDREWDDVWQVAADAWTGAMRAQDIETMWKLWTETAESYLLQRASQAGMKCDRRHAGRGKVGFKRQRATAASASASHGAATHRLARLQKLARRIEQLVRDRTHAPQHEGYERARREQQIKRSCGELFSDAAILRTAGGNIRSVAALRLLGGAVRQKVQEQQGRERAGRAAAWKHWLRDSWKHNRATVFEWCRGEVHERTCMVQRPNGSLTANADEVDDLLLRAWLPIFRMYADVGPPDWHSFASSFGQFAPKGATMHSRPIDAASLRGTLMRMSSSSSCGLDGWRVTELKALPIRCLERLAELLNAVERSGTWPQALAEGIISLINKGEGASALRLRPISVMSVVYRLWAATRGREVLLWQETWISEAQRGSRPAHGTHDAWYGLAIQIEHALLEGTPLSGVALDYSKCFDKVPTHIAMQLAENCGLDEGILRAMRALYAQLSRRFALNGNVGETFSLTNGILQGMLPLFCPDKHSGARLDHGCKRGSPQLKASGLRRRHWGDVCPQQTWSASRK